MQRGRGLKALGAVAGLAAMAVLMVALVDNASVPHTVLADVDAPNELDNDKWEWYGVGSERDDGHRHLTRSRLIKHSWPKVYPDPADFPTRQFRVVPLGASMQLHDVDAPNEADQPKSKFYEHGAARDDEFARIPYAERVIAAGLPEWSPNPSEFPIKAVRGQQMLARVEPEAGMRVFRGTGDTMVIEPGARAGQTLPSDEEAGWSVPAGQYNPTVEIF